MTQIHRIDRTPFQFLPEVLTSSSRFLLWKKVKDAATGKIRKVPYYSNGRIRKDELDTPQELANLCTITEALNKLELFPSFTGIGFAVIGDGVAAFDFDKCLDPETGLLLARHPATPIVEALRDKGVYIEVSPSGTGLHAIGLSSLLDAYSNEGVEYWAKGRYLTVTGQCWANPRGWASIEEERQNLGGPKEQAGSAKSKPYLDDDDEDAVNPQSKWVLRDLKAALVHISADEYDTWTRVGIALKEFGQEGLDLWKAWSSKSDKYDPNACEAKWETYQARSITYRSIFQMATEAGWNPKDKPKAKVSRGPYMELGEADQDFPTEFVIDGFLPIGLSVLAGVWGAGKSTNLIPLAASVAHLAPSEWGFHPELRRKVLWITEAPSQARDTLHSLSKEKGSAPWSEIKEWFKILPARRVDAETLVEQIQEHLEALTVYVNPSPAYPAGYPVRPLIVLDTVTANLDLENESDNSEVGAFMSEIKASLPEVPIVLIGHTPKGQRNAEDNSSLTFRGAGAWEAEAESTYYLVHDEAIEVRYLVSQKLRFAPEFREIHFGSQTSTKLIPTPWGTIQSKTFVHGVPSIGTADLRQELRQEVRAEARSEREQEREEARLAREAAKEADRLRKEQERQREKEEQEQARLEKIEGDILRSVEALLADGVVPQRLEIVGQVSGNKDYKVEVLNGMVLKGEIIKEKVPKSHYSKSGQQPYGYFPAGSDLGTIWDLLDPIG